MKKKVLGILVTSAIVGTMLMGCGSGSKGTTTAAPAAAVEDSAKPRIPNPGKAPRKPLQLKPRQSPAKALTRTRKPGSALRTYVNSSAARFPMAARKLLQARLQNSSRTNTGVH